MFLLNHTRKTAPIAIYDSGVGGLAITKVIKEFLPQECIHYIGDTQNLPYGEKTETELSAYIKQVVNFSLNKQYKLLIIACNTAAAAADHFLPSYLKTIGKEINIINVIDPVVEYIIKTNKYSQIGLIGTTYTTLCEIYEKRFQAADIALYSLATPLLAPMVEACFFNKKIDSLLLNNYLSRFHSQTIQALIPACTHYIFLEKELKDFFKAHYQKEVVVVNTAQLTALAVKQFLTTHNLLNNLEQKLPDCFMATLLTPSFQNASKALFGQTPIEIDLKDAYYYKQVDR